MRAVGTIKKVDGANRVVIPDEICQRMKIEKHTPLEIFVDYDDETIIFKKYKPGCMFCGGMSDLKYFKDKFICLDCRHGMPE